MDHGPLLRWDVFCRVVDNFGDAGVCWRLACGLAARGQHVRLIIDDPQPLTFMAPTGHAGVEVMTWPGPPAAGDVVVEAFGCDPPAGFVHAMAASPAPPVWINLEYLSAEPYVERSHELPSPQRNGMTKWFFYPGFTEATGGLLREGGLLARRRGFDRGAWLAQQGLAMRADERAVSLFCYDNARIPALLEHLAEQPTLLLLAAGHPQRLVQAAPPAVRLARLPWLTQADFDHLLWAGDLNFVRGEDSLVRAIWAGAPFVWQAYPQDDGAHRAKIDAVLGQLAAPPSVAACWHAWNGTASEDVLVPLPDLEPWGASVRAWRDRLAAQHGGADLAARLHAFASGKARIPGRPAC